MKQKPKTSLSVLQRKRLLRIGLGVMIVALAWLVFAPGRGMYHLRQRSKHLAELKAESQELVQQNSDISRDIERLQSDDKYLNRWQGKNMEC